MLEGRFVGLDEEPLLHADVAIARFGVTGSIRFLLDTGSDHTVIHPADAVRLGIDHSLLANPRIAFGIGGEQQSFAEPNVVLSFREDSSRAHYYWITVDFPVPSEHNLYFPSIIGRDLLHRWRMFYDFPANRLEFDILSSDYSPSI